MKKLKTDLKRMLTALAMEDSGDFLTRKKKRELLGDSLAHPSHGESIKTVDLQHRLQQTSKADAQVQVAVLFNGEQVEGVIDYALNTPHITHAKIDILAYGQSPELSKQTEQLCQRLQQAGRATQVSFLQGDMTKLYQDYRNHSPALRFMLAADNDLLAHEIINNTAYHSTTRAHVPLVLIQNPDNNLTAA
ncbi:MAG: hypothetical protein OEY43_07675 [Gammaproteobacteria bacterium]|nr:hypothetical protein [Gammaproteobacteria bacterium]